MLTCCPQKYTVGSVGIWEKIRRAFAIDPNRSTGVPLNSHFRVPAPMSVPAVAYTDPVTTPAGDIADNPYWKRDVRRNYARTAVFKQSDISNLLTLGSVANPRIEKGDAGAKQLVAAQGLEEGKLAQVLEKVPAKEVLQENGLPPLPGKSLTWKFHENEGSYSTEYPCRSFA